MQLIMNCDSPKGVFIPGENLLREEFSLWGRGGIVRGGVLRERALLEWVFSRRYSPEGEVSVGRILQGESFHLRILRE